MKWRMTQLEIVLNGIEEVRNSGIQCPLENVEPHRCLHFPEKLIDDIVSLLEAQEQEINRLKHHVDCDGAEKLPSGCVGYGRGINDDEPCETCKACEKYNGYGEE